MFFARKLIFGFFIVSLAYSQESVAMKKAFRDLGEDIEEPKSSMHLTLKLRQRAEIDKLVDALDRHPRRTSKPWVNEHPQIFAYLKDFAYFSRLSMVEGASPIERESHVAHADICLGIFKVEMARKGSISRAQKEEEQRIKGCMAWF